MNYTRIVSCGLDRQSAAVLLFGWVVALIVTFV